MSQSSFIAAFLLLGFILYLAAQNRLSTYAAVLWGNTAAPLPAVPASGSLSSSGGGFFSSLLSAGKTAATIASVAALP